ncbi:Hsp33 family molecular chaperone HslO [Horticoccus luteus]|uniref:Hsp33 family molecular chaperone HslO n=1 Tax=Horticoccus luteus TaxID=2862869 RepID=A0A8F9XGX1_9BACT|nr:Hsp33 family molecular chaperone HslO [Horticoccus luteus]QYM79702.1 Hsp33 family molecular chaperone HslO [Horticoccus luteus]
MPETTPPNIDDAGHEVRTYFVRGRNALVARANFSELFVDYYLHLADQKMHPQAAHDAMFKRALAAFTLHCASRPWNELTAWTINFQAPLVNLFLTGDNTNGAVTGRVFDDNVKELPENLFYADVVRGNQPTRRSTISFTGAEPLAAAEKFYRQSEQRVARYFQIGEEDFVMVTEHPDCDMAWLEGLTTEAMKTVDETETLALLERRIYRWHCGCNQERMMEVLAPAMRHNPEELFGGEPKLEIRCPRCGARHAITREGLEAFVASHAE